jgi:DNA repair protein RadC
MTETGNKGHRKRLRDRFAGEEKDSCSEEALLELLLTYAIPRKDVQPLVKSLLVEFGNLMAVLQTPMKTHSNRFRFAIRLRTNMLILSTS